MEIRRRAGFTRYGNKVVFSTNDAVVVVCKQATGGALSDRGSIIRRRACHWRQMATCRSTRPRVDDG